jgi:hypothetical protein
VVSSPVGGIVLLLWLLALAAAGPVAQRKSRDRWIWVLATLFFGPIAFVLLLALPSQPAPVQRTTA